MSSAPSPLCLSALGACAGEAPEPAAEDTAVETPSPRDPIVGTYELVGRNVKDENGEWVPIADFNSLGYITYSDRGYMGVNVMPFDREPFADSEPTAEEVQAALQGYTGYYGPFSVNEDDDGGFLIHHRVGQINPGGEVDAKRYYDLVDDKLILTPASATGMKSDAMRQVVWQRLPDVPQSEEAQRFLGQPRAPGHGPLHRARRRARRARGGAERGSRRLGHHLHAHRAHDGCT